MALSDFFKPLFIYKKYLLAHKVLKQVCGSFIWITNEPHEKLYLSEKNFGETYLSAFLLQNKNLDTIRLIEAIELLEKNRHIKATRNANLYKYSISPTKLGERAFADGYYMKQMYKWVITIYGSISGSVTILILYLPKLLKYMIQ